MQGYALENVVPDPKLFLDVYPDKFQGPVDDLSPDEIEEARKFLRQPTEYVLDLMFLLQKLHKQTKKALVTHRTVEQLVARLETRKETDAIAWEQQGVGKAELITLGKGAKARFLTKVRHNALKTTFLFVDKAQLDLRQIEELPDASLSPTEYQKELEIRKGLSREWRRLIARMVLAEWNPKFTYSGLSQRRELEAEMANANTPQDLRREVIEALELPAHQLEERTWFQRKIRNPVFDLALASERINDRRMAEEEAIKMAENEVIKRNGLTSLDRELVLVYYDSRTKVFEGVEPTARPSLMSFKYWKMYWDLLWEPPAYNKEIWESEKGVKKLKVLLTGDYLMGMGYGLLLSSLATFTVGHAVPGSMPHGLTPTEVFTISFSFSLFFGVLARTTQNYFYRGSKTVTTMKNWFIGLLQSYLFAFRSDEILNPFHKGEFNAEAAKIHANIVINQSIKAQSKAGLQELPKFRDQMGEAPGTMKFRDYKIVMPWEHNPSIFSFEMEERDLTSEELDRIKFEDVNYLDHRKKKKTRWWQLPVTEVWTKVAVPVIKNTFQEIDIKAEYRRLSGIDELEEARKQQLEQGLYEDPNYLADEMRREQERSGKPKLSLRKRALREIYGFLPEDSAIPRRNFEGQLVQIVSTPVSLLSRFGWSIAGIPLGHLTYLALGPAGGFVAAKYKLHYAHSLERDPRFGPGHPKTIRIMQEARKELAWFDSLNKWTLPFTKLTITVPMTGAVGYYFKPLSSRISWGSKWMVAGAARKVITKTTGESVRSNIEKIYEREREQKVLRLAPAVCSSLFGVL